ncbi:hypothetical protein [Planotetraspora sp. GP83]|uniref:hypothetical protein n=1 Tax=Planotetraspora sp. GP83 TaxID=3156264 RepID=UPI00351963C3
MWGSGESRTLEGEQKALGGGEDTMLDAEQKVLEGGQRAARTDAVAPPGFDPAKVEEVKKWAFDRYKEVEALHARMSIQESDPSKDDVEKVVKRLRALEIAVAVNHEDPVAAKQRFEDWARREAKVAWLYYVEHWKKQKAKEEEENARKERDRRKLLARQAVVEFRKTYAGAPDPESEVGTVLAGLVDVKTGLVWLGSSGVPNRRYALTTIMRDILKNVRQVEKWKTDVCAEVDVMNTYIKEIGITSPADIVGKNLNFHAETWDDLRQVWKARGACGNCRQWITDINADHGG